MEAKIFGWKVHFSFIFVLLLCCAIIVDKNGFLRAGIFAAIIHEFGHLIAMVHRVCVPGEVYFSAFGVSIVDRKRAYRSYNDDVYILIMGPCLNFAVAMLILVFYIAFGGKSLYIAMLENLFIGAFNMLPIEVLDGGQILFSLFCSKMDVKKSAKIVEIVSFVVLLPIAVAGFYILLISKYNFSLLMLSLYLMALLLLKHHKFNI